MVLTVNYLYLHCQTQETLDVGYVAVILLEGNLSYENKSQGAWIQPVLFITWLGFLGAWQHLLGEEGMFPAYLAVFPVSLGGFPGC